MPNPAQPLKGMTLAHRWVLSVALPQRGGRMREFAQPVRSERAIFALPRVSPDDVVRPLPSDLFFPE
jgi:hypothetical protein